MLAFGFIVSTCFVPGWIGAGVPTQWPILSALLPLALWRRGPFGPGHLLGLTSLTWAAFSITWSTSHWDAAYGFWLLSIAALAFWLGSTLRDLSGLFKGLAIGLSISSAIAILQWFGINPVLRVPDDYPSGLLYNSTVLGASVALVSAALVELRLWLWVPTLLPALYLSHSRGAWLVLAIGLLARWVHWAILILGLAAAALYFSLAPDVTNTQRLFIWGLALQHFNLLGNGIGSFDSLYYLAFDTLFHSPVRLVHSEFVHNDYIQLWFELGIGAIPIYIILALALYQRDSFGWPIVVAFATLATFYFPLYCPLPLLVGCVATGRCVAYWHITRDIGVDWRSSILPWYHPAQLIRYCNRRTPIPALPSA